MKISLSTFQQSKDKSTLWLIPVFEGKVNGAAKQFGFDARRASAWGFKGKADQTLTIGLDRVNRNALLLGAGNPKDFNAEKSRQLVAGGIRHHAVGKAKAAAVLFDASGLTGGHVTREVLVEALAEGAALGGYSFTRLKGKGTEASALPSFPARLIVALDRVRQLDRRRFNDGLIMAKWTNWGRDLMNQSQSHFTAVKLANLARNLARGMGKVRCSILGRKEIASQRMGLLLAVNQGSSQPPRFIILQYNGGKQSDKPICLVGKGITFDTGGYNLKPGEGMRGMHMDKGGAVGALASFFAAVELGIKKNLVCLVPSTDNRVSGSSMCPGDVYTATSGISVEVDNTDAEGRLILADALAYAKKYNPSHLIDMATLTGAAVVALGDQASALFCSNDQLTKQLLQHADEAGELIWRLPLWSEYNDKIKSRVADIKNTGGRWAGSITAALFLQRFVPKGVKWCHLDMAGKMKAETDQPYTPVGSGYGFGPRLIGRWLRSL